MQVEEVPQFCQVAQTLRQGGQLVVAQVERAQVPQSTQLFRYLRQSVVCKNQRFQRASFPYRIWDTTQFFLPEVENYVVRHTRDGIVANACGSSPVLSATKAML